jgi:phosphoheptose isomerase
MITSSEKPLNDLIQTLERMRGLTSIIDRTGLIIAKHLQIGGKLLTAGNGGSAADALHLAEELVGRFEKERPPLPAICLNADPTLLTCIGNDYGFQCLFSRQVEGLGGPNDILVVFSTSGKSMNLLAAVEAARKKNVTTIALLGKDGGTIKGKADHEIIVPSMNTARVQEVHTYILHSWLALIEAEI